MDRWVDGRAGERDRWMDGELTGCKNRAGGLGGGSKLVGGSHEAMRAAR